MYAIIGTGGKQYRVSKGDLLKIELLPPETKKVTFSENHRSRNGTGSGKGASYTVREATSRRRYLGGTSH